MDVSKITLANSTLDKQLKKEMIDTNTRINKKKQGKWFLSGTVNDSCPRWPLWCLNGDVRSGSQDGE